MTEDRRFAVARSTRVVSPELALVDPVLAAEERARPSLSLVEVAPRRPPPLTVVTPLTELGLSARLAAVIRDAAAARPWISSPHRLALIAVFIVLSVQFVDLEAKQENASVTPEVAAPTTPGPTTPRSAPRVRRFAWAPVAGAQRYEFELFQGASLVYSARSARPQLTVPARWRQRGRERSLTSGEYRWYVWPVVAGRRSASAVVQARLTVS